MNSRTWIRTCSLICLMVMVAASMAMSAPYKIYEQIYSGGHGSIYYIGAVEGNTAYTGQIGWSIMQWGDEQILGNALLNHTADGLAGTPAAPVNNMAKCSLPMNGFPAAGGWLYAVNGANYLYRTSSWGCNDSTLTQVTGCPAVTECICTDGTYIYMTTGSSGSGYNNIWKLSVDHANGSVSTVAGWPKSIATSANTRFRGISYYGGKLYLANFKMTGEIYEMDATTGASTLLATTPTYWQGTNVDSNYQVVRYGNKLYCVGLDCNLYTYTYNPGPPASATLESTFATGYSKDGVYGLFGIGVKGDGTNAKYAWISCPYACVSFWDLDPQFTPGTIGDARKAKNGYPVAVQNAVVTKSIPVNSGGILGEFWAEDKDRAAAAHVTLWVGGTGSLPQVGQMVNMTGGMSSNAAGEKEFTTKNVTYVQDATVKPLYLNNKNIGPATGSAGLATDGMLVKVTGKVTKVFIGETEPVVIAVYVDDGSGVATDTAEITGVKVPVASMYGVPNIADVWANPGNYEATVLGIVRLEKLTDGTIIRKIEAMSDADIVLTAIQ